MKVKAYYAIWIYELTYMNFCPSIKEPSMLITLILNIEQNEALICPR